MARPRRTINYDVVFELARVLATDEEIATSCNMSIDGFNKRKARDAKLRQSLTNGKLEGKTSLRRSQWLLAQSGNPAMNIWLGKQWLGQRENPDLEVAGEGCLNQLVNLLSGIRAPQEDTTEDE